MFKRKSNNITKDLENIYNNVKNEQKMKPEGCFAKPVSNRRKKILDSYYERNKDIFIQHGVQLEEFEFSQVEWDDMHNRFVAYEKNMLVINFFFSWEK